MAGDLPIDFTKPLGQLRALIPDVEILTNPNHPAEDPEYMFSDGHLGALLAVSNNDPLLAAAMACDVLGTSETIIAKSITTQDLVTNGLAMMQAFLARGKQLREEALRQDNQENADTIATIFEFRYGYPHTSESMMLGDATYDGSYRPIWP
jgi:hypothetical protein